MNSKQIYKPILLLLSFLTAFVCSSCQRTFEEINTNRYGVTTEMSARDGIALGAKLQTMMTIVTPVGTAADGTSINNAYQVAYHLNADILSGYFGENNNWNGGNNPTTLTLNQGWLNAPFVWSYTNIFAPWLSVKNHPSSKEHPENFALAQILKISTWHKQPTFMVQSPIQRLVQVYM